MSASSPAPAPSYDSILDLYTSANQSHLLKFYPSLSPEEQMSLLKQLAEIDVARVNKVYAAAMKGESGVGGGEAEDIEPLPSSAFASIVPEPTLQTDDGPTTPTINVSSATPSLTSTVSAASTNANTATSSASFIASITAQYAQTGLLSISQSKTAVVLLAGGQGTRLGSSDPKGCYDIGLPSGKSLFQLQAERIRRLGELAELFKRDNGGGEEGKVRIPWYVMTSGPTRKATEEFFKSKAYFGMRQEDVIFFDQGVLPALSDDGKILLSTKSTVSGAPDGNGGVYAAMRQPLSLQEPKRTVLSDMRARGIEHVHAYCVDNCLVKVADPVFLGYCIEKKAECGAKVVRKETPTESVGVLARKGSGFAVVEYSELSREKSEQRDPQTGGLAFRAANIANHYYTLGFLEQVESMEESMAFHIARKKIPTVDMATGEPIKPSEPNGMKLEMFIFDVFPFTSKLSVLEVERREEFSPLKNATTAQTDNAHTSRRDLLAQQKRWILDAGAEIMDGAEIELGPLVTYAGEGLESIRGKVFVKSGAVETLSDFDSFEAK